LLRSSASLSRMSEKESFSAENRVGAAEVVKRLLMDCGGERMVSRDLLRGKRS
jgi:hypothetical protein